MSARLISDGGLNPCEEPNMYTESDWSAKLKGQNSPDTILLENIC